MSANEQMLIVQDLFAYYGRIQALKGVSLRVERGEIVAILGANGAGKTTLLKTISGLIGSRQGKVEFNGADISRLRPHQVVRRGISHVPEGRQIFAPFTVAQNLELGALTRFRSSSQKDIQRSLDFVYGLFPRLYERKAQLAGTLSGGEQQMLAIGRALMAEPKLLLLDEPSLGLAPQVVQNIVDVLRELNASGLTILIVEQNTEIALEFAHRGYILSVGTVVMEDSSANLISNDAIREIYFGLKRNGPIHNMS